MHKYHLEDKFNPLVDMRIEYVNCFKGMEKFFISVLFRLESLFPKFNLSEIKNSRKDVKLKQISETTVNKNWQRIL